MPNWCSTTFRFRGEHNQIVYFHDKIIEWTSQTFTKTDFGKDWLGNILYGVGLEDRIDNPDLAIRLSCRGTLLDVTEVIDDSFYIYTETAWVPMAKMWEATIHALNLSIEFTFEAEEQGCELYWIYDPNGYGDFDSTDVFLEINMSDGEYASEYMIEKEAIEVLNLRFGINAKTLDEALEKCNKFVKDEDSYIAAHRFELINELYD